MREKLNIEQIKNNLEQKLKRKVSTDPRLHQVQLLFHSDSLNIHWLIAAGKTEDMSAAPDQPFHTASIGKTFTAVILAKLYEKGLVKFDDRIADYLPQNILEDLHVYKGKDYTYEIKIEHLLKNTSGLPDYFEEKPKQGKKFMQEILEDSTRFWSPEETIHWSKARLQPRFPPGKGVHYTDTGYNLLGLIIESITLKPYHEVLHEYIFNPLEMQHSYLSHYSEPKVRSKYPTAHVYLDDLKISVDEYRSFSSFYAGGQTVSTTEDLLAFMKALVNHELIQKETLNLMQQWNRMRPGMQYGSGLMRMLFIPFTKKYVGWGHLGATGSSMLYFPKLDTYVMGSFNQTAYQSKSLNFVFFHALRKLSKLRS